ncbi:MAG: ATP-dependent metallopeptidase FtsH/Yme1/Tma family protein [Clostridiaceae bacterium]
MNIVKNKYFLIPISMIACIFIIISLFSLNINKPAYKTYNLFINDINQNLVYEVNLTSSPEINVKLKNGQMYKTDNPRKEDFKEQLLLKGIKVSENQNIDADKLMIIIPILILSALLLYNLKVRSKKKNNSFDSIELNKIENSSYSFKNVAGNYEVKENVMDIISFLKNPDKFNHYKAKMPKGILLYGEPGTGKTLIAKAIAQEAGVPFYSTSGSDFVQIYVGVGASRIRQLFKKAKESKKAVIFIDEIDAIGKKRSQDPSSNGERDQTLNALLTEMSGFNDSSGIVVIAATNRIDTLDPALLRPGRFDRHIEVPLPDKKERVEILNLYLNGKPLGVIDVEDLAGKTVYFSGAKLEAFVNEAAILACREESSLILSKHFESAYTNILAGSEKKDRSTIRGIDKKITAYHEAGHTLISYIKLKDDQLSKVTIIPTTKGAGGYTLSIPEDRMYHTKEYLKNRIMVLLAGRAAEEVVFGEDNITTGASNDLETASKIIWDMANKYGMVKSLGLFSLGNDKSAPELINECKNILDDLYKMVKTTLKDNMDKLTILSEELIEKETLHKNEIYEILKKSAGADI